MRNQGNAAASNVLLRVFLPLQVNFVNVQQSNFTSCQMFQPGGPNTTQFVNCTANAVAVGQDATAVIVTQPNVGLNNQKPVTMTIYADPNNSVAETNEANNTASVVTTVSTPADLAISSIVLEKSAALSIQKGLLAIGAEVAAGCTPENVSHADMTVHVRVVNNGPGFAPPTKVRVSWIGGVRPEFSSDCPPGNHCDVASGTCTAAGDPIFLAFCFDLCDVPGLSPGQSVDVVFRVVRGGDFSDYGVASVDQFQRVNDPNRANNVKHVQ